MKNKIEYMRTNIFATKKASNKAISEQSAEIMSVLKMMILALLSFDTLTNTAESVSKIIIIKNISTCQNSKKADVLNGSMYCSSSPKSVTLTASANIPKFRYFTKTSERI